MTTEAGPVPKRVLAIDILVGCIETIGRCLASYEWNMRTRFGESHYGAERRESGEEKAERMAGEELKRRRWNENSLSGRRKSDPEKVKIALRLRRESIMTLKWIAQRLQMGSWTNVSNCLANKLK